MSNYVAHTEAGELSTIAILQAARAAEEKAKSWMLRAWLLCGVFFMTLPGTLLGFSNLLAIGRHHGLAALPPAWIQGHGHAQVFGWIGSFVLGIGFYSQPVRNRAALHRQLASLLLWEPGVLLRWFASIYAWHWRLLAPLSVAMECASMLLFLASARHHKRPKPAADAPARSMPMWMIAVLASTAGFAAMVLFDAIECVRLAIAGVTPAFPHALDQRYLVLMGWGFLAPVVWGFSARWLPVLLGLPPLRQRFFGWALALDAAGVLAGLMGAAQAAVLLLAGSALGCVLGLGIFAHPVAPARTRDVSASFPFFARITYLWLLLAAGLGIWAAWADHWGGIWGASRHALTVGFAATMVFTIGPRILPNFAGFVRIFSRRLMFAALFLLQLGCTLRVGSEPLAYEHIAPFAWKLLPVSGVLELSAVLLFAANLLLTLTLGQSAFHEPPKRA